MTKSVTVPKNNIKVIAFDFDGVFVRDSDAVFKQEAWLIALDPYGSYEAFLAEGKELYGNGKAGGRREIFRHIFERLGERPSLIKLLVDRAVETFDQHVQVKILEAGLVPGSRYALEELTGRGLSLYLNSGTALGALSLTVRNLEIDGFFKEIYGCTQSKADNLRSIMRRENIEPTELLVVGDGGSDAIAAEAVGSNFVGVANKWNKWGFIEQSFPVLADLRALISLL